MLSVKEDYLETSCLDCLGAVYLDGQGVLSRSKDLGTHLLVVDYRSWLQLQCLEAVKIPQYAARTRRA